MDKKTAGPGRKLEYLGLDDVGAVYGTAAAGRLFTIKFAAHVNINQQREILNALEKLEVL